MCHYGFGFGFGGIGRFGMFGGIGMIFQIVMTILAIVVVARLLAGPLKNLFSSGGNGKDEKTTTL